MSEASFVIDAQQRITQWSFAAAALTGAPRDAAIGQPCYDVVRGGNPFGSAVCQPECSAFKALRSGRVVGRCHLLRAGAHKSVTERFICELVALPRVPGGAVATLYEQGQGPLAAMAGAKALPNSSSSAGSVDTLLRDLGALTTLSTSLVPDGLEQAIEQTLDWVRQAADAEAAELFLAEPLGRDLLLSGYRGPFRSAFSQITRFPPGQGFPGLVASRGEPILTQNLPDDPRYLRTRVKERGFLSYVCVPLLGSRGVLGVINMASRRPDVDLDRALRLLTWASRPISTTLEAGLLLTRESLGVGLGEVPQEGERELDDLLRAVLHRFVLLGNATGGALLLYDPAVPGLVRRIAEGEFAGAVCPGIRLGNPQMCPALASGHGIALHGPRHQWPRPCQKLPEGAGVICCVPLLARGEAVGIIELGYGARAPWPPTRYLPALLNLAERAADAIRQAWRSLKNQQLALSHLRVGEQTLDSRDGRGARSLPAPPQEADSLDTRPSLEVRCFGVFELYRQGSLVTREMFRRRGALTLLKILLIYGGQPVPRDVLAELLWPEADPQAAANRLYVLVHTLRQVVEPSPQDQPWRYICSDGDRYYFNPKAPCQIDIQDFWRHISLAEHLEQKGAREEAIEPYEAAVALYRGDLLEDEPYAEWCWQEREHLRETCLTVLKRLAVLYAEKGALDRSIERYRRALRIDPVREEHHRGLMRVLSMAGRRDEALRQYQVCRDILRRELEVAPLPETEELYALLRDNAAH